MMKNDFIFTGSDNESIAVTTYGETSPDKHCVIYLHGFKGFKDWGFVPFIGEYLADNNFFVITFNFSHNGIGENRLEFTEEEKFANNTFSLELEELNEVIDAYLNNFFGDKSNSKIGLIGHSRGGGDSLLVGSLRDEIGSVVLWASVANFNRYSERQANEWRKKGVFEVLNTRTNQMMKLNLSLLEDLEKNRVGLLNLEQAAKNMNKPMLILHGEQDLAVPVKEAEQIYDWSNKEKTELFKISATGHTFDVTHPFRGSNSKLEVLLDKTFQFFNKNLN